MKRTCLLVAILLLAMGVSSLLNAAVSAYVFTQSTGTYAEISGGTVLGTTTTDDQRFVDPAVPLGGTATTGVGFPIGFDFVLDGYTFDRFAINYNGWISFGQSALTPAVNIGSSTNYPAPLNSTTVITPSYLRTRFAGFAQDLQGQTGSELSYLTIGSAPDRVLVIQWKGVKRYGSSNTSNINFQIRLYEGLNTVQVIYGGMTNNYTLTAWSAQTGLGGSGQADYNNRTSTTSWSSTTPGVSAASTIPYSSTIYPPSGLTFEWGMPSGPPVLAVAPTSWNFGPVLLNSTNTKQFILSNAGGGSITLNSVTASGLYYSISQQPTQWTLASGQSTTFEVSYNPTAYGDTHLGAVTIDYDTSSKSTFVVDLSGACPDPTITLPWSEDFTGMLPGTIPFGWSRNYTNWGVLVAANAGGVAPEMRMFWTPAVTDQVRLASPPLVGIAGEDYLLSFKHFIDYYAIPATYKVQYSVDMANWTNLWTLVDPPANVGPETVEVVFPAPAVPFYISWVYDGNTFNTDAWCIDDIVVDVAPVVNDFEEGVPTPYGTITITLGGGDADLTGDPVPGFPNPGFVPVEQFVLYLYGAGPWTISIATTEPWGAYYQNGSWHAVANVGGFITFVITAAKDIPSLPIILGPVDPTLPVELSGFFATLTAQNFVKLTWISQSETGLLGYRVYRNESNNQSSAVMITPVMVPATNTSTTQTYSITDSEVAIGSTYWYWLESVDFNHSNFHGPVSVTVEGNVPPVLPEVTTLRNAYPNPFKASSSVNIGVEIKAGENGTVTIYNILGQAVRSFSVSEGIHNLNWNGKDSKGNACGSGIYFYKLSTPSMNQTKKMVIVK